MHPTDALAERETRLYSVLAECLRRLEAGGPNSTTMLATEYPEFATEVAEFLAHHCSLNQLFAPLRETPERDSTPIASTVGGSQKPRGGLAAYELLGELGRGGMAVVYKARDRRLQRLVALKMVELPAPSAARRFHLEAQLVATLDHPHIVRIYDVGEDGGRPFFTMKLFEGGSLARTIADREAVRKGGHRRAAEVVATIAGAVHHAHGRGILHRDLKPANILLDTVGEPHVADFGLARRVEIEAGLTQSNAVVGTPGYMAPEQALGRTSGSVAGDVYSLGAILYELLTGERVNRAATPVETLLQVIARDPPRPRRIDPTIPRDVETICLKCLERNPEKRYASAAALADDLKRWLAGEAIVARPIGAPERMLRWARGHATAVSAAAVVAVVALVSFGVGAFLLERQRALAAEAKGRAEVEARAALEVEHYFRTIALADRERATGNPGQAESLLDQCPVALRGWEFHYLRRQPHGSVEPFRASSHLFCLAVHPSGERIAVGGSDGSITIWRPGLPGLVRRLTAHNGYQVRGVAFSPNGALLASAGWDGKIKLWLSETGEPLREWKPDDRHSDAFSVAFSPDGSTLAASVDSSIWRWNLATGEALPVLRHEEVVRRIAFSPTGRELASIDDGGMLNVWDLEARRARLSIRAHPHLIFDVSYSRDGTQILTAGGQFYMHGDAGEVKIWDAAGGSLIREFTSRAGAIYAAAFTPDGSRVMAGGEDRQVHVWDAKTGQDALALRGHAEAIWGLGFSPDGSRLYSVAGDHLVRLWDATPLANPVAPPPSGHELRVTSTAFGPRGQILATAGMDGIVQVRNPTDGVIIRTLPRVRGQVHGLAFSPNGEQLAAAVWRRYGDPNAESGAIVWDTRRWERIANPDLKTYGALGVAYSPDGRHLVAACDHAVTVLDTATWKPVWRKPHPCLVTAVAMGRDEVICGDADGRVTFRDLRTGDVLGESTPAHSGRIFGLALSSDQTRLASAASDDTIRLWDVRSREMLPAGLRHKGGAYCVAFTPGNGRLISGGNDGVVRVWDARTGLELRTISGHTDCVYAVAVHPDGAIVVTGSRDRTVRFWTVGAEERPR